MALTKRKALVVLWMNFASVLGAGGMFVNARNLDLEHGGFRLIDWVAPVFVLLLGVSNTFRIARYFSTLSDPAETAKVNDQAVFHPK